MEISLKKILIYFRAKYEHTPNLSSKHAFSRIDINSETLGIQINQSKLPEQNLVIKFRNYKNYNEFLFNEELQQNIDLSPITKYLQRNKVDSATETLIKVIPETAESHAPLVEKKWSNVKKRISRKS